MQKFHANQLLENILFSSKHRLTFISNPKVACSTIKNSLLGGFDGNVHQEARRQFGYPKDVAHEIFCITRNPYSRALSCFKNKIGPNKEKNPNAVWHPFCRKYGFDENLQPSFRDFLTALANDSNPIAMDMHYRCQHFNLHHEDIKPSFIGRIEKFDEVEHYLACHGIQPFTRNKHYTGSSKTYKEEINDAEKELIKNIYLRDFEIYGYDVKIESKHLPESIHQDQDISYRYQKLLQSIRD